MQLTPPYLIFLGDVATVAFAKTAFGLVEWVSEACIAQLRFPGCGVNLGLPDMDVREAVNNGARSLILGSAPVGGRIQDNWIPTILEAIDAGMDIVSGLHTKLVDYPQLRELAKRKYVRLIDIRIPPKNIPIATGKRRRGKRLLTVGTDCVVGKKYTALALTKAIKARGISCDFRATGQTGIMIAGGGIPIDAVVSDFVAGAAEILSPNNDPNHWDVIEGQGSLYHPAYAGVSLGLLHGSQPDAIVLCHEPVRESINGFPHYPMPDINACIKSYLEFGALTNPDIKCVGVCLNTSCMDPGKSKELLKRLSDKTALPCVDPLIEGVETIVETFLDNND